MKILLNALIKQGIYHHRQAGQPGKNGNATKRDLPQFRTSILKCLYFKRPKKTKIL